MQTNGPPKQQYDYFISHATEDKEALVLPVTKELDKLGIRYFLDTREIPWGKSLHQGLSNGFIRSRYFLAFISEKYVDKKWTMVELEAAFHQHVAGHGGFMLPLLVGDEHQRRRIIREIPLLVGLKHLVWNNNASAIAVLLAEQLRKN